jgi:hypothetical protein
VLVKTRQPRQRNRQILLLTGVFLGLVLITVAGVAWLPSRLFG